MSKFDRTTAGSFLSILVEPDFDTKVLVPPYFSKKHEARLGRGNVRLRIGSLRKTWNVEVEKTEGGMYALTSGWDKFFRDAALQYGDYVIFKVAQVSRNRRSTFDVSMYGVHGCECLFPGDVNKGNTIFTAKLQKRHIPRMHIPIGMANEETGMMAGEWVKLRNGEGKEWPVRVCRGARVAEGIFLKDGWRAFWEQSDLSLGNELRFELVHTKPPTLLVVITKGTARVCNQIVSFKN